LPRLTYSEKRKRKKTAKEVKREKKIAVKEKRKKYYTIQQGYFNLSVDDFPLLHQSRA